MKIIYLGKFRYSYSTEQYVTYALRQNGVQVEQVSMSRLTLEDCKQLITSSQADVVLFAKSQRSWIPSLLGWCKEQNILTVCWLWDLYWGYGRTCPKQFHADLLFTTDGGHKEKFDQHNYNHSVLRQGIHVPEHIIYPPEYAHEVAFIGGRKGHPQRSRLLAWLSNHYGQQFVQYTHARGIALNKILAKVKIVVGDSFPSPNYWSNRIYEITGRGGFILHPETIGLENEFTEGEHYISYPRENHDALRDKIEYWLSHNEEREAIRQQGFKHCGQHHTYTLRLKSFLDRVLCCLPRP